MVGTCLWTVVVVYLSVVSAGAEATCCELTEETYQWLGLAPIMGCDLQCEPIEMMYLSISETEPDDVLLSPFCCFAESRASAGITKRV